MVNYLFNFGKRKPNDVLNDITYDSGGCYLMWILELVTSIGIPTHTAQLELITRDTGSGGASNAMATMRLGSRLTKHKPHAM